MFERALHGPTEATVLVALCDCAGFRRQTRGSVSADVFAELNALYLLIDDAIPAAGGLVVKFMGDAALVIFPEGQADAGVMALLELKATVDSWLQQHPLGDSLQVNAHLGEVTLGRMGRAAQLDVIGETVAIAATLGSGGFGLSAQAFRRLSPEHQRLFERDTLAACYRPVHRED